MASKLENRVSKLENNSTVGKTHLVLPSGWWYGEEEAYETTEPFVRHKSLSDWYESVDEEKKNGKQA